MYFLATNEGDVFHYGEILPEQELTTGQPELFYFETEQALIEKLAEYGQTFIGDEVEIQD